MGQRPTNVRYAGLLNVEKKFSDQEYSGSIASTVTGSEADPATGTVTAIAQGDGAQNRDGRHVKLLSLHVQGHVEWSVGTHANAQMDGYCRIYVVQDLQTNGAQFSAEDVLKDPTDQDLDVQAFRNLEHIGRFKVLKSLCIRQHTSGFHDGTNYKANGQLTPFEMHLNLKGLDQHYSGTTQSVANITDNSIHIMAIRCFQADTDGAILKYIARTRFIG
jgi:hypothetical protein